MTTADPIRILHVLPSIDDAYGGPPRAMAAFLPLSAALGMRSQVVAGATTEGEVARQVATRSDLLTYRPGVILGRLFGSVAMLRGIWVAVGKADVVLSHSLFTLPVVFSGLACRLRGKPWVLSPHSCLDPYDVRKHRRLKQLLTPLWRALLRGADLWCLTDVEARHVVTFGASPRVHVVPPPIDVTSRLPVDDALTLLADGGLDLRAAVAGGGCVVSFVGRFDVKKGIPRLLDCFDQVAGDDDLLVLAGRGDTSYERVVDEHVAQAKRRQQVVRPGWLSDERKVALWSLPGIFALPSDNENFAVAVAEAMGAGVPVVISDQVGLADLVQRSGAGLVTRLDSAEFAAAVADYLTDSERRWRDGDRGRAAVQESMSVEVCLQAFRQMLETAIDEHRPTRGRAALRGAS